MDGRYLEPEIETAPREKLRVVETKKLRAIVEHAAARSPFYARKFKLAGLQPGDIRELEDLPALPFTTKDELKTSQSERPPWGDFLAVPAEECTRVHFTSATTGRAVAILDTAEDWHGFYHSYARGLYGMGLRAKDMVMTAFSFGPWIGFWSGFYAAQEIGCLMFPNGGMSTEQRIDALLTYPITGLGCTPSYAIFLAEQARAKGIDLARQARVRLTWHTGEPGASIQATKRKIEEAFGAKTFDLVGLTEIAAWGFECAEQSGQIHVHEDYVYPEILDTETGKPVEPGQQGELVFTSLYRKAMPLLRYRTRDVVRLSKDRCPCGRTLLSVDGGVLGRLDDMKKIRGVIVYPTRIEEVVRGFDAVDEFRIVLKRVDGLDELFIYLDPKPGLGRDFSTELQRRISDSLRLALGLRAAVELVEPGTLPRWDHKARRLVDERTEVPF